jgi:hypothetical protein
MRRTITRYHGFADFCQHQATRTNELKQRQLFEAMATEWRKIAEAYEGLLRRISPSTADGSDC